MSHQDNTVKNTDADVKGRNHVENPIVPPLNWLKQFAVLSDSHGHSCSHGLHFSGALEVVEPEVPVSEVEGEQADDDA